MTSIIDSHATDRMHYHICGGVILTGNGTDYCDRCGAFAPEGECVPNGTNHEANNLAYNNGDPRSPDALE